MSIAEEIARLDDLRSRGVLSDDEFQRAKARLIDGAPAAGEASISRLRRSNSDRWIGGVCGGLGVALGIDAWVIRLVFAALLLVAGTGVALYLLLWIFVPPAD
jgi:phage shock protein PspC (stress-responsive transcriptional regulator)